MGTKELVPRSSAITVNSLRREVNLERWDRSGIPVRVRFPDGREYVVSGIYNDRDALVLSADSEPYTVEPS